MSTKAQLLRIGLAIAVIITALCLVLFNADKLNSRTSEFFTSSEDTTHSIESDTSTEQGVTTSSDDSSVLQEDSNSEPTSDVEITKFFNSGTHPDLFYIKSTGFELTQKQTELNAIITEGYTTEGDKITAIHMVVYPMLGFKSTVFDQNTSGVYSFSDFKPQDDGSYRLDITSGRVLESVQSLSASTSMVMLAGSAKAQGISILDENGNLYTVTPDGNLALLVKPNSDTSGSDIEESNTSGSESNTSEVESGLNNSESSSDSSESGSDIGSTPEQGTTQTSSGAIQQ